MEQEERLCDVVVAVGEFSYLFISYEDVRLM